jgi:hypothetical protein
MIIQLQITNKSSKIVIFRGIGFNTGIPGYAVDYAVNIPVDNAIQNIENLINEHPYISVAFGETGPGLPANDPAYIAPDSLSDQNYRGVWDASAGAAPSDTPEAGWYWLVTTSGTYVLDGIGIWNVGDYVKWNGNLWMKIGSWIDQHESLGGLVGGDAGEHYHLTSQQHAFVAEQTLLYPSIIDGGEL